jgi:PCI domain
MHAVDCVQYKHLFML